MSRLLTDDELSRIYHETNMMSWHESLVALERIAEAEHKETLKAVREAINDYAHNKISFERLAELLEMNVYELDTAFCKYGEMPEEGK